MPADLFLNIPAIPGESKAKRNAMELLSWGIGESNPGSFRKGGGGGIGKVDMQDFTFTKNMDSASWKLFLACANGSHLPEVTFTARKAGGAATTEDYLIITLKGCVVSFYSTGGRESSGIPTETFNINFAEIEVVYKEQNDKGAMEAKGGCKVDLRGGKATAA